MKTTAFSLTALALAASAIGAPAHKGSKQGQSTASATASSAASVPTYTSTPGSGGSSSGNSTSGSGNLGVPTNCLSKNNIAIGWLPDEDNGGTMGPITKDLGANACFYGLYSQITGTSYDASQLTSRISDIKNSGAVLQAAVMPTKVKFSQVDSNLAGQICSSMQKLTDEGITVWLRLAHEFNWYVTDGTYAGGSTQDFVQMWQNVATACKGNDKIKMYWSPNNVGEGSTSALDGWWPGAEYVDMVGIDVYPPAGTSFASAYGNFYRDFAEKYNKPFFIGETGSTAGDQTKQQWLTALVNPGSGYPLYQGMSWFEYDKSGEGDFRVVTGDQDIAKSVLE